MNDFSELEAELKKLRPAPISDELLARIERDLSRPEPAPTAGLLPRPRARVNFWSLGLGLAGAAALLVVGLGHFDEPPPSQPRIAQENATPAPPNEERTGLQPSTLTRVVYQRRDEGLVFSPNHSEQPLRRVRYQTRDTMQWRDPQTGASLRVSYPAEQVVLTPVSFQ
jgi:hypothetical protein